MGGFLKNGKSKRSGSAFIGMSRTEDGFVMF